MTFSCYLIGADTLLTECAELLLAQGHDIRGIISATPRIGQWARSKKVPILDIKGDYKKTLAERPFDYLFAITHLSIIPDDVLALPKKGSINFHDGPLPRYAGLNTPVWGLINREPQWGITFHLITSGIDRGDILEQRLFDIAKEETALSLNTRAFATAIEVFGELVRKLDQNTAKSTPQVAGERLYFSRHQRPEAGCVLDFGKPAVELEALARALDFGRYANPVGSAKLSCGDKALIVARAEAREDEDGDAGAILSVEDNEVVIMSSEGALAIKGFQTLGGKDLPLSEAVAYLGLEAGKSVAPLTTEEKERLTTLQSALAKSEDFWMKRLTRLDPIEVPYAGTPTLNAPRWERVSLSLPTSLKPQAIAAVFAAYLARIGGKDEFDLAFSAEESGPLVSGEVPLHFGFDLALGFDAFTEKMSAEIAETRAKKTFFHDLVARVPELHARPELRDGRLLPVGIAETREPSQFVPARPGVLVFAMGTNEGALIFDANMLSLESANEMKNALSTMLASAALDPTKKVQDLEIVSAADKQKILVDWNKTELAYRTDACVHQLIEEQAKKTPNAIALVFESMEISYRELNERANALASHLVSLGVGPDELVGIYVERSHELVIAALAAQKAGGAYLPLDPAYPADRIAFMIEDSKVKVIVTEERLVSELPKSDAKIVCLEQHRTTLAETAPSRSRSNNLAYVIYTSGSTGKPKGVQIEHKNVVNFFAAMDERLPPVQPGDCWLAVTSLSFDIHVLELFWTLTRGFKVVVFVDRDRGHTPSVSPSVAARAIDFGLFMWGNDDAEGKQKYDLMLKGARYFDEHGFNSVWTPERHFHAFGGPYPNPSVTGAAIAAITSKVSIRAGSCVSPLHHPIRIAEEWAVVDNISDGRVGLSFASGWQPNDFVIRPENHKNAKNVMLEQVEIVRRLWRGEAIEFQNPLGQMVPIRTLPRPVQKELPVWVTTAGNPQTYKDAANQNANVLTHLLGQSVEEVAEKIKIYRTARAEKGLDPAAGIVTLMLHTFIGHDVEDVRNLVRQPMKDYLSASVSLVKNFAWAFPAFKRPAGEKAKPDDIDLGSLSKEELDAILEFAFERYFETSGLFGTPESCMAMVNKLKAIGVDEIACLLDFGVPSVKVLDSFPQLKRLRDLANAPATSDGEDYSIAAQIKRHKPTHMQCTPSMARMLLLHDESKEALRSVKHMFVGGEAFPVNLAKDLGEVVGSVTNMYGPTETTIWSSTHRVTRDSSSIPIGRPIGNTSLYILDKNRQPLPAGVPGELYIGGAGVVRGYLFRPELTAERFVPDPFRGGRMYRTGDLARFRKDGVVDFLGRTDHQVKIRGYRIELGEIETLFSKHAGVRECVVLLREDTPGDQRLVGYYVPHAAPVDPADLKSHMRAKLPEYMVPGHFAALEQMPLTPNGKIDRKGLPSLDALAPKEAEYVAPEGEIEEKIAKIWQETLNKDKVGIEDNFFDIGGHSLLVVRMHRKLRDVLDKPISITDLYRFPTIRSFSSYLNSDGSSEAMKDSADRAARRKDMLAKRRGIRRPRA